MTTNEKNYDKSLFRIFLSYFPAHKNLFILDMCCAFIVGAIDVAFPLVSRYVMYDLLPDKAFDELSEGRTTLMIAHRLATSRNVYRVVVIEEGRIQEEGTQAELLTAGGEFAKLYKTQMDLN